MLKEVMYSGNICFTGSCKLIERKGGGRSDWACQYEGSPKSEMPSDILKYVIQVSSTYCMLVRLYRLVY